PVTNVLAESIHVDRLTSDSVENGQGDELLRKLIRPVVVRAVGYDRRQPIRAVPRAHQMIGAGLARRVRRARIVWRVLREVTSRTERPIDLVGGNVHESKRS